jgi:hypothetical protein
MACLTFAPSDRERLRMRLMPDYTILLAYLMGWLVTTYGIPLFYKPTLLVKGVVVGVGYLVTWWFLTAVRREGFATKTSSGKPYCSECDSAWPCPDHSSGSPTCPPVPDMSKYVLKTSIPPCKTCPDMDNYMLKTECPPVPDMSQYVLKSSVPKQGPVIVDTSACGKQCGECPPCPRPRCPEVKCPPAPVCPTCPPCPRPSCPQQVVKCKAEDVASSPVRPFLAPLGMSGFGLS